MKFMRLFAASTLAFLLALVPVCSAVDAPDSPLKEKDLSKSGTTYVLPAEKELADAMKDLRKLHSKLATDDSQRRELEGKLRIVKNGIAKGDYQKRQLYDQFTKINDVTQKNNIIAKVKVLESELAEANGARESLEKQLNGLGAEDKSQFINNVLDLTSKVDKAMDDYKALSEDGEVKAELAKAEPGKPKMKLGPSEEFAANVKMLKKWRGDVSSDKIAIKHENNIPMVEVTLNGNVVRDMIVDSGASMICLTTELATKLNMVPTDKDETIQFTMADGKVVDAKHMVLKSVRVGQFTVADVDCAVLPATLVSAEPLLGGTFLNNFVFKIDPNAGEMHLAVIAGNTKVTTAGTAKDKKAGAASTEK